jgi:hypothetical protein
MRMYGKIVTTCLAILSLSLFLGGCGGSSGTAGQSSSGTGVAKLDVTDAPASDYSHVYVTVTGVAFHTDAGAGFSDYSSAKTAGWQSVKLATPKTVDLAQLSNGTMYADVSGNSLFSGITLPVGRYQQIRIFLASSEDAYVGSVPGLTYNNEVQLIGDSTHYPLRIPSADSGIKLLPEAPVVVTSGGSVSLALDFNLSDDVIQVSPNGTTEFLLKPRLGYFDMASVAAVKGAVSFGNLSTSRVEVKAEQVKTDDNGNKYRVVRRMTGVDRLTGNFKLYPLPVFGNATTAVYDILIRGRKIETTIVKGVTVHKGTTPDTGVDLGSISLQAQPEFTVQLPATGMHPTGAWMNFYQTVAGDPVPFEVRYRHLDPYTGKFGKALELSTGPVLVATYTPGQPLVFTTDTTSQGSFAAVADAAWLYRKGAALAGVSGQAGHAVVMNGLGASNNPQVAAPATGMITGTFDLTQAGAGMGFGMGRGRNSGNPNNGQIFVTKDGLILDSLGVLTGDTTVSSAMRNGGGAVNAVTVNNLPSGVPGAVYSMYALGWGPGVLEAGTVHGIDLRNGNGNATIRMK